MRSPSAVLRLHVPSLSRLCPFEVMLLPVRHVAGLEDLTGAERDGLAAMLQTVTSTYDKVFDTPFPYSMGLHPQPCDGEVHPEWHFHAHFFPPLLRSATIRKFMVGFEMLGTPLLIRNDLHARYYEIRT